jgi:hypothetical protein
VAAAAATKASAHLCNAARHHSLASSAGCEPDAEGIGGDPDVCRRGITLVVEYVDDTISEHACINDCQLGLELVGTYSITRGAAVPG